MSKIGGWNRVYPRRPRHQWPPKRSEAETSASPSPEIRSASTAVELGS
jgi:hypothetical protein